MLEFKYDTQLLIEGTDLDEDRINAWTLEQSRKLWGALNHREY